MKPRRRKPTIKIFGSDDYVTRAMREVFGFDISKYPNCRCHMIGVDWAKGVYVPNAEDSLSVDWLIASTKERGGNL